MPSIARAVYTATATSTGGRTGTTKSSDGKIELQLSTPKALGGDDGPGTNPEQLFASGYSACFIGALKAVAGAKKFALPKDVSITADVSIGPHGSKAGAFNIAVKMAVSIPGVDKDVAEQLVAAAHEVCPYSNATRGNIDVALTVI
jgi:Ohr subfamily peroxiredoxin